jgi:hypothetical protein
MKLLTIKPRYFKWVGVPRRASESIFLNFLEKIKGGLEPQMQTLLGLAKGVPHGLSDFSS